MCCRDRYSASLNESSLAAAALRTPGLSVQSYGETVLAQLPNNSLLLSHTDLTWNSVRYLQVQTLSR
jgi:hypothetical protein